MTRAPSLRQANATERGKRPPEAFAACSRASAASALDQLAAALAALRQQRGRRLTYVRWAQPLGTPDGDPWAAWAASCRRPPTGLWAQGGAGPCWAAGPRLLRCPAGLADAHRRRAQRLADQIFQLPVDGLNWGEVPQLVGAWPFFAQGAEGPGGPKSNRRPKGARRAKRGPWPAAPEAWVPRLLFWRQDTACWVVRTMALPTSGQGCRALARQLLRAHAQLQARLSAAAVRGTAAASSPDDRQQPLHPQTPRPQLPRQRMVGTTALVGQLDEGRAEFAARVGRSLAQIAAGRLQKVVLARQLRLRPRRPDFVVDAVATAHRLRAAQPAAHTFLLPCGRGAVFVGATPELLVRVAHGQITSQALAGTRRRDAEPGADAAVAAGLLASAKDKAEHAAVVAGLRQALAGLGVRTPSPPEAVPLATGQLWHLHTPIAGRMPPTRAVLDVVAALHPSPAVGGAPRAAALRQLAREEPWRGSYAGPIGWLSAAGGTFAVAIRSMVLTRKQACAFAGAGIVAGSTPEGEWQETAAKLQTATSGLVLVRH